MGFSRQEYWSGVPLPSPTVRTKEDKSYETLSPVPSTQQVLNKWWLLLLIIMNNIINISYTEKLKGFPYYFLNHKITSYF